MKKMQVFFVVFIFIFAMDFGIISSRADGYDPEFPPSRFNRVHADIIASTLWEMVDAPNHLQSAIMNFDPNTPEGEAFRLLINHLNHSPMPEGWYLTWATLGGQEHHLYHEFDTHEIMLQPYSLAFEYIVVDVPWTHEAELHLMQQADLLFEHFDELLAVSFRVQKVERVDDKTDYKNAQLTRERVPINGVDIWCYETYVTHVIPFYVSVGDSSNMRVTFPWIPVGFELHEVENIIKSLSLEIESIRIADSFLQYRPNIFSFEITLLGERNTDEFYHEKSEYLFNIFQDLMVVDYFINNEWISVSRVILYENN